MLYRVMCGFAMGVTIVAPGMSASVAAVMLGIYHELIEIISNPLKNLKRNIGYLLPLGLGAALSVVVFVALFAMLFDRYPVQTQCLFLGLVVGGLPLLKRDVSFKTAKKSHIIGFIVSLLLSLGMALLSYFVKSSDAASPPWYYLSAAGLASGVTAIVPGMSVSVMLMVFGVYDYLLTAASSALSDPMLLLSAALPTGVAFVAGIVGFSNVIKWVFRRYKAFANFSILGFVIGTVAAIVPLTPPVGVWGWVGAAAMLALGLFAAWLLGERGQEK